MAGCEQSWRWCGMVWCGVGGVASSLVPLAGRQEVWRWLTRAIVKALDVHQVDAGRMTVKVVDFKQVGARAHQPGTSIPHPQARLGLLLVLRESLSCASSSS